MDRASHRVELTRRASRARVVAFVVLWLAGLAPAADGLAQYGAVATVEREIPATNTLDATAAGTEVKVADRIVAQTMNELLQRAAGTRVVQSGAQGEPFCLRLRGAPCDQTTVLFGDAPISNPDTGAFDLSLIPLEAVDGFQVFRGGAPTWISQGAIGGVLRLLPREVTHNVLGARVTAGSFGSWRANLYGGYAGDRFQFFGTGGAAGAKNDFPFRFDNGTVFDPTDDEERRRQNADFREGFGSSNMVVETSDKSQLRLVFLGVGRERGLPGAGARLALRARDQTTRLIGSASWTQEDDGEFPYRLQLLTSYDYGRNRVDDRFAEIGTGGGRLTDDRNNSIFARAASEVEVQRWLELTAIASARYFFRNPDDELASMPERDSDRLTLSGTIEANFNGRIGDVLFELRPSVLLSWTRTFVTFIDLGNERENQSSDFLPTYRVGGAVAPLEWLSLRGSVSSGFRLPNTLQLFGNRSTILANPELRPEKSLAYDAGITLRGHRELLSGYLAVGYFLSNVDNQIRFRRTSQFTLIAENIEGARNQGVEAEVRGGISPHFLITGELTWTQARDDSTGNQLPGQPELVAFVSPEGHTLDLSERVSDLLVFVEVNHIGRSFADPANLVVIGARTTFAVGIGALFFDGALGLGFRADDLFDVRGQDLLGFPLPGRRYSGRVTYERSW